MVLRRKLLATLAFVWMFLLTACQEELYSNLTEREANEMLALLLKHDIPASKTFIKEGEVTLKVETGNMADAIDLLHTHGFPRESFDTVGTVFQKQGLVTSPAEDHIRLVYALSQELNETLSRIDGVLSARVHVVLPEVSSRQNEERPPSSAAVFIRYQDSYDIEQLVAQIKTLVANSIEGLSYDNVSVALFPVKIVLPTLNESAYIDVLNIRVDPTSRDRLLLTLGTLGFVCLALLAACIALIWSSRRKTGGQQLQRQGSGA